MHMRASMCIAGFLQGSDSFYILYRFECGFSGFVCVRESQLVHVPLQELDFSVEVTNAERCRKNFSSKQSHVRGRVAVCTDLTCHIVAVPLISFLFSWISLNQLLSARLIAPHAIAHACVPVFSALSMEGRMQ